MKKLFTVFLTCFMFVNSTSIFANTPNTLNTPNTKETTIERINEVKNEKNWLATHIQDIVSIKDTTNDMANDLKTNHIISFLNQMYPNWKNVDTLENWKNKIYVQQTEDIMSPNFIIWFKDGYFKTYNISKPNTKDVLLYLDNNMKKYTSTDIDAVNYAKSDLITFSKEFNYLKKY